VLSHISLPQWVSVRYFNSDQINVLPSAGELLAFRFGSATRVREGHFYPCRITTYVITVPYSSTVLLLLFFLFFLRVSQLLSAQSMAADGMRGGGGRQGKKI